MITHVVRAAKLVLQYIILYGLFVYANRRRYFIMMKITGLDVQNGTLAFYSTTLRNALNEVLIHSSSNFRSKNFQVWRRALYNDTHTHTYITTCLCGIILRSYYMCLTYLIGDTVNFDGAVEPVKSTSKFVRYSNIHFCPTINGLLIECLTELRRYACSLTRSDILSGLNAMLKDVLPFSLVANLRLEGKASTKHFCDTFFWDYKCNVM